MPKEVFSRDELSINPLSARENQIDIEKDHVLVTALPEALSDEALEVVKETASKIAAAKEAGKSVILDFGAHTIKNGLSPVLIKLIEDGWVTHLATNGAGIIHDWEFAFQGASGEDVSKYVAEGQFGIWQETGNHINLAIVVGAYEGLGYGESVGAMIEHDGLLIPSEDDVRQVARDGLASDPARSAAAADLLDVITRFNIPAGRLEIKHPFKKYSVQAAAFRSKIPMTGHPMLGQDIIYCHPMNHGAAIGRTGLRDFLAFADSVSKLDGGVYMSIGSAIMSPMIFEKALSMCRNVSLQDGRAIADHYIAVVDLAAKPEGWTGNGEPSKSDAAYYVRSLKTFSRMGGQMRYASASNVDFLLGLLRDLLER